MITYNREGEFQADVVKAWESLGGLVLNVHGHGFQKSGWPDLQLYHRRWTGHLELKLDDAKPSTIQRLIISDLNIRHTKAYILRFRHNQQAVVLETELGGELMRGEWAGWNCSDRGKILLSMCRLGEE